MVRGWPSAVERVVIGYRNRLLAALVSHNRWREPPRGWKRFADGIMKAGAILLSLGVYISVPFCRTKCSYCNFASDVFSRVVFDRYVERVCADIGSAFLTAEHVGARLDREVD